MSKEIRLVPLDSRFLFPYYKNFTENVTRYQMADPFETPLEAAEYFRECKERESAGYSIIRIIVDEDGRFIGSIEANALIGPVPCIGLWIAEEFRNKGFGSKALNLMIELLRSQGYKYDLYETDEHNQSAIALLNGFSCSLTNASPEILRINDKKTLFLKKYVIRL